MADQKITELTELGVEPAAGDLFVVVDIDASGGPQTKKVSFADLTLTDGFVTLDGAQTITGSKTFNSSGVQTFEDNVFFRSGNSIFLLDTLNTSFVEINNQTSILQISSAGSTEKVLFNDLTLAIVERPAAPSDVTAQGQVWVRDDTPNVLMYTNDAGTDKVLSAGLDAGSVTNATPRWDGSDWVENPRVQTNLGVFEIFGNAGLTEFIRITQSGVTALIEFDALATSLRIGANSAAWNQLTLGDASAGASLEMGELSSVPTVLAGLGQVWVRNDTPNVLMYTDDAGTDFELNTGGGGAQISGTPVAGQIAIWDSASSIEGDADLTWIGNTLKIFDSGNDDFLSIDHNGTIVTITTAGTGVGSVPMLLTHSGTTYIQVGGGGINGQLRVANGASTDYGAFSSDGTYLQLIGVNLNGFRLNDLPIYLDEQASANADQAGLGQVWVRNDAPNVLVYTDDDGTDFVISGTGLGFGVTSDQTASPPAVDAGFIEFATTGTANERQPQMQWSALNTISTHYFANTEPGPDGFYLRTRANISPETHAWGYSLADTDNDLFRITENLEFEILSVAEFFIGEKAAAVADKASFGQVWVRNDTPNTFMFTDDAGTDFIIGGAVSAAYIRNATVVEDRTLLASASATATNNNNVLAALIADLQTRGVLG